MLNPNSVIITHQKITNPFEWKMLDQPALQSGAVQGQRTQMLRSDRVLKQIPWPRLSWETNSTHHRAAVCLRRRTLRWASKLAISDLKWARKRVPWTRSLHPRAKVNNSIHRSSKSQWGTSLASSLRTRTWIATTTTRTSQTRPPIFLHQLEQIMQDKLNRTNFSSKRIRTPTLHWNSQISLWTAWGLPRTQRWAGRVKVSTHTLAILEAR